MYRLFLISLHMVLYFFFLTFSLSLELSINPELISKLVPEHAKSDLQSRGIEVANFTPIEIMKLTTLGDQQ